ncbi:TIGR03546 family protein [Thalassotalea ponticola]|uniref:TIGR03546 family protein n=1 Tax=Thalassotalea ponticola TaxID=1523392 RepID=UPI0025B3AA69|nr:TIGR03546 family protein [Thalassotalea ponticola]MDN3651876.1 TIGR03546 family protein [Thalassotalea ponticola]
MLTMLAKLFKALNSESSTAQIALAIALGMVVGLTPTYSLHNLILLLVAFVLRINLSAFFLSVACFSLLSLAFGPVFALVGEALLTQPSLQVFWQGLYQYDLFKLASLHHTLTLGALLIGVVLFIPVYLLSKVLVQRYRQHMKAFVDRFKLIRMLKGSRFYQIYQGLNS